MTPEAPVPPADPDWEVITLGALCERGGGGVQTGPFGSQLHADDYVEDGIPVIMPQDLIDSRIDSRQIARISEEDAERLSRYRVTEGDIVYSRRGDVRRRVLIKRDQDGWLCGTGCLRVRVGTAARPDYLAAFLGHPAVHTWIEQHAVGATMLNLNTKILSAVPITLPDTNEQGRIADVLGALDEKIDSNGRLSDLLTHFAYLEFRRMFGGRLEGTGRLGDHVVVTRGRSYKSSELADSDRALVTLKSIRRGGGYSPAGLKPYTGDFKPEQVIQPGELVVAHTDLTQQADVIGRPAIVPNRGGFSELIASLDLAIVRPADDRISESFLFHLLLEPAFQQHAYGFANGSTVLHLSKEAIPSFPIQLPDRELLSAYDEVAVPLMRHARCLEAESRTLADLRDAFLPKLVSGGIRVPDSPDPTKTIGALVEEHVA